MNKELVLFVCEHGAAKSIIAAALFNKRAGDAHLPFHAIARGTDPDEQIAPAAAGGLAEEGLQPREDRPAALHQTELVDAAHVVWFGDPPSEHSTIRSVERWTNVPAVSENYGAARTAIGAHVDALIRRLTLALEDGE